MTYVPKSKRMKLVYHDTEASNLSYIQQFGLKRKPPCNPENEWMDEEAERRNIPIRKCDVIYAYIPGWGTLLKKGESPLPTTMFEMKHCFFKGFVNRLYW